MNPQARAFSFKSPLGMQGIFGNTPLDVNAWWHPGLKLLVDTGYAQDTDWLSGLHPELVFITHHHPDHDGGVVALRRHPARPAVIAAEPEKLQQHGVQAEPANRHPTLFSDRFEVLYTPGHARQHYSLFDHHERALYAGDMVLARGTPVAGPPDGSFAEYMESLDRLIACKPDVIYAGHGGACGPEQMQWTYDHRRARLDDVLEALAAGPSDAGDLVSRIYEQKEGMVLAGMHRMAAEMAMRGYLDYLLGQGEVLDAGAGIYALFQR